MLRLNEGQIEADIAMEDELKVIEASIIEELAAGYSHSSVNNLAAQRDADIKRVTTQSPVTQTPGGIRDRLRGMLVLSIELIGESYHDEAWRSGVEGAILEGRMSVLREMLDWMEIGAS